MVANEIDMVEVAKNITAIIGAVSMVAGLIYAFVRWLIKQEKQSKDIAELKEQHQRDMDAAEKKESENMKAINNELSVLSYAMLAALDGLQQLHCNGNVTKAHKKLEKHLNTRAHDLIKERSDLL